MHGAAVSAAEEPEITADVVYGHKDGLALTMDVFQPRQDANGAAILFVVSGGWFSRWAPPQQMQPLFVPYLDEGYTVLAVRHGSSPRYTLPEAAEDVRRAVRYVHTHAPQLGIDADRVGVLGMSAGGHLALLLGTTGEDKDGDNASSRVAAVVALVPPTDLTVMVWEAPETLPAYRGFPALNLPLAEAKEHSPLHQVTEDDAPALVFMGGKDELVPADHGRWIDAAFEKQDVPHKLIVFPDAGHGLEGAETRAQVVRQTVDWFNDHLQADAPVP